MDDGVNCNVHKDDGKFAPVNWIVNHSETSYRPALIQQESTYSQLIYGNPVAMTVIFSEQWPDFELFQVSNLTHSLSYQQYQDTWFHCTLTETR